MPSSNHPDAHLLRASIEVSLRLATWQDVPLMFEIGRDPVACEMAGVKPRTREVFEARWREVFADPKINTRVIEVVGADNVGEFAGSISVFQAPSDCGGESRDNIGYWLARELWGKGIASRAVALFLLEEKRRPLHATTAMDNLASQRVLTRNGFVFVGKHMGEETERYMAREVAEWVLE